MPQRQLNIRSDEAVERAASLARRLGRTATDIVVEALRSYEAKVEPLDELGMTAEQRKRYDVIKAASREISKYKADGATSDHDWLYDENGLPK